MADLIQKEDNSGLIDIKQEMEKNGAALDELKKSGAGADGPGAASTDTEPFLGAVIGGGGKTTELAKQAAGIAVDVADNKPKGNDPVSMLSGGGKAAHKGGQGGLMIQNASERGKTPAPARPQSNYLVHPGYFTLLRDAKKVDRNHKLVSNVNAAGNAVAGRSDGHPGNNHGANVKSTPEAAAQVSHTCNVLQMNQDTLSQMDRGPLSRTRLLAEAQDGKAIAEEQLRTASPGERVEIYRNVAPSVRAEMPHAAPKNAT